MGDFVRGSPPIVMTVADVSPFSLGEVRGLTVSSVSGPMSVDHDFRALSTLDAM